MKALCVIPVVLTIFVLFTGIPARGQESGMLYVVNTRPGSVGIYDVSNSKMLGRIQVGELPLDIALSPDGRWFAVSHRLTDGENADFVWIIDREKGEVVRKIDIPVTRYREHEKGFLLFSRDGKKLYVVDSGAGFLDVVRTSDWRLVKKVKLGIRPQNPVLSANGQRLYVPCLYSRKVFIVDTGKDAVTDYIAVDGLPSAIALSPDEATAYVADMENHSVLFIDLKERRVVKAVAVGTAPGNLISLDGRFLYVLNTYSNSLSVVDIAAKENIKTLAGGILPRRLAFDTEMKMLYIVSQDAGVIVVDVAAHKQLGGVATDITPAGIVFVRAR